MLQPTTDSLLGIVGGGLPDASGNMLRFVPVSGEFVTVQNGPSRTLAPTKGPLTVWTYKKGTAFAVPSDCRKSPCFALGEAGVYCISR